MTNKGAATVEQTNFLAPPGASPVAMTARFGSPVRKPSGVHPKHRRVMRFEHFSVAQIHVHAARQTGIKTSHGTHNVYAFEFVRAILFKDRRVLHGIFV